MGYKSGNTRNTELHKGSATYDLYHLFKNIFDFLAKDGKMENIEQKITN
jgi:hypothetical protein